MSAYSLKYAISCEATNQTQNVEQWQTVHTGRDIFLA